MIVKEPQFALKSDGTTRVPYEPGLGFKLGVGTWYVDVSMPDASTFSVHCTWDATLAATSINYQGTNLPAYKSGIAPTTDSDAGVDVSLVDATAGNWVAPAGTVDVTASATGYTTTGSTVAVAGTNAGGVVFTLNEFTRRGRIKIVVTTAGYFRCHPHGKQA